MEEKSLNVIRKNSSFEKVAKIFWIFLIGSIIGYIVEMVVGLVQNGHFVSRQGLLFGPFTQVYGVGLAFYYLAISQIEDKKYIKVFFICMLLGGMVEYLFSYFQEKFFGTISWDYSNIPFNINGRTSLLHCTYWGIGGVLYIKFILPLVNKFDKYHTYKHFKIVTCILIVFMTIDITLSILVGTRQLERKNNVEAKGAIDLFIDKYYPDEKLKEIYSNAKFAKEKVQKSEK